MTNTPQSRCERTPESELGLYLQQIPTLPRLNAQEEKELSARFRRDGCSQSRERLICSNLRLVVYAAKQYRGFGVPLADLVEAGNLGLLRATDRFDPAVGTRFSTYAIWWIKQAIVAALAEHGSLVRCPASQHRAQRTCRKARERLNASLGHEATLSEISRETGLSITAVRAAKISPPMTAASNIGEDTADAVHDAACHAPGDDASQREMTERVRVMIDGLSEREREIVRLHFGLNGCAPLTISRIAGKLRMPADRVTRLLSKTLESMRKALDGQLTSDAPATEQAA